MKAIGLSLVICISAAHFSCAMEQDKKDAASRAMLIIAKSKKKKMADPELAKQCSKQTEECIGKEQENKYKEGEQFVTDGIAWALCSGDPKFVEEYKKAMNNDSAAMENKLNAQKSE